MLEGDALSAAQVLAHDLVLSAAHYAPESIYLSPHFAHQSLVAVERPMKVIVVNVFAFKVSYQVLPRPYDSFLEGQISIVKDEAQIEAFEDVADDVVGEVHVGLEGPADQSVVLLLALGDVEDEPVEDAVAADEEGL